MNGDVLTDIDYERAARPIHRSNGAAATIATTPARSRSRSASCASRTSSRPGAVTDYIEKPTLNYEASMGVYCFDPRVLRLHRARACGWTSRT